LIAVRLRGDHFRKEEAMKYVRLIHRGENPVPGTEAWGRLSEDERKEAYGAYEAIAESAEQRPAELTVGGTTAAP
jgi:hypothetical protein